MLDAIQTLIVVSDADDTNTPGVDASYENSDDSGEIDTEDEVEAVRRVSAAVAMADGGRGVSGTAVSSFAHQLLTVHSDS